MATGTLSPITALIKANGAKTTTRKLNDRLRAEGFIESRERKSTADPSKVKTFTALTEKGLAFGENVGNQFTDETAPRYYTDRFAALLDELGIEHGGA